MPLFRKKPATVEARQVEIIAGKSGSESLAEHAAWCGGHIYVENPFEGGMDGVTVRTLHGSAHAEWGDWIIRGEAGDYWPCKADIFAATYEPLVHV